MTLSPRTTHTYHVFPASPGDVAAEPQHVRRFFDAYNRHTAHTWNARFEVSWIGRITRPPAWAGRRS